MYVIKLALKIGFKIWNSVCLAVLDPPEGNFDKSYKKCLRKTDILKKNIGLKSASYLEVLS